MLLQQKDGTFTQRNLFTQPHLKISKDMGIALFDADNDGDPWIFIQPVEDMIRSPIPWLTRDELYINDGKGNFKLDNKALPENFTSKSCVRAADFDKDGDLDLFIAGRSLPGTILNPFPAFLPERYQKWQN